MSTQSFSCFLIGADTLLIECGELLLEKGHTILGVISSAPKISQWAHRKSLTIYPCDKQYPQQLKDKEFDFLFSITHLAIISDEVLALPKKGAVNFHDGPLPAYAGLNTPAWALMNAEEKYGISWHEITPGVDEGRLLKQAMFDTAPDETSLSINTKCFAAALDSFPVLVDELAEGKQQAVEQDLSQRSYFGKFKRPARDGLISWQEDAEKIEALVRALDFGDYANLLVTPKVILKGQVFSVKAAIAREQEADVAPGQIVAIEEGQIDVATGNGILSLNKFAQLNGKAVSPGELQTKLNILVGDSFTDISSDLDPQLDIISKQMARADEYWTKRLAYLDPIELPYIQAETKSEAHINYSAIALNLPSSLASVEGTSSSSVLVGTFALLAARLSRKHEFDLAFTNSSLTSNAAVVPGVYNEYAALHLGFDLKAPASTVINDTETAIRELNERGAWAKDIVARHAELAAIPELVDGTALPLGVQIGGEVDAINGTTVCLHVNEDGNAAILLFDPQRLSKTFAEKFAQQFESILRNVSASPDSPAGELELITQEEKKLLLEDWNSTQVDYDNSACIHHLFEARVEQHPNATALVFEDTPVTYSELNNRANQLAAVLVDKGFGPDDMIGVNVNRSIDLMVATIGVHKAGAAYVPLDPAFPSERIAYMVGDAKMRLVITQNEILADLPESDAEVLCVDDLNPGQETFANPNVAMESSSLAYVIYTSGSTGNPKGVMVEHRNATNFFLGMDDRIEHDPPGTWLAVTSLSFDISVLELFWTLTRGFKVIIYREDRSGDSAAVKKVKSRPMDFGLFMWGNDDAAGSAKYKLMLDGAKYFDENGFNSVWTPERHFSAFGGPYPNPAVTSAALAAITKNVAIRSGSIVSPLHHPVRIAEDWAVVDNLSDGRVGLSFAAGWQPNDFIIMPQNHKNNKQVMLEQIEIVKKLWRGEKVAFENPMGDMVETATLPRPVQKELPIWLTTAGNPESYRQAGKAGVNVLTHLLGQSVEEVTEKIRIYREARKEAGFDPAEGKVTLMLHTFVGECNLEVRELVREPMKDYLRSAMKLVLDFAWAFPAFKRPGGADSKPDDIDIKGLSEEETDTILDFAFERYFETSGLFGTPETCLKMIDRCKGADIDEIACLLDFGVATEKVMAGLPLLKEVRDMANASSKASEEDGEVLDQTLPAQLDRHEVTHFQCTPSMARMLGFDPEARPQMAKLKHMMVGGEAFPNALAKDLRDILTGRLTNMYGPTETTIWSTTQDVDNPANIPIGRPIANTDIFILDENRQPVPPGVPGDLFIGGQGVVRGYLNRPELTDERFILNPFKEDGSRIYWTGDLAKYREDGVIEFLGRIDHQVKIRGYRIELGEIEALLGSHDSVQECVLLLREDTPGDQRLVAYMVTDPDKGPAPDANSIRDFLRTRLPEYMVPNDVVTLDAMPLTPNGKLDRKQLPAPSDGSGQSSAVAYEAPQDELQQTIVNIWQDTLKLDKVGVNDNFFDLGGHSLLIVRVHQLLKQQVDKPISLTDLYRFPTIGKLTEFLNSDQKNESLKKSSDRASRRRERMGLRKRGRK